MRQFAYTSYFLADYFHYTLQIVLHGISIDQKVSTLDGESPLLIVARSLLASEKLVPVGTLNKVS